LTLRAVLWQEAASLICLFRTDYNQTTFEVNYHFVAPTNYAEAVKAA